MIESIRLSNFLSFGSTDDIDLRPINVVIGTNGSGKSNFLEAFDLLRSAPTDITKPIREGGGVLEWLHKGGREAESASLDFLVRNPLPNARQEQLRYKVVFTADNRAFTISDESITSKPPEPGHDKPYIFYDFCQGKSIINILDNNLQMRSLQRADIDMAQSILVQIRDTIHYPEITALAQEFGKIRLYREWSFGRYTAARLPQKVDLPNNYLEADGGNLGLALNFIRNDYSAKKRLLQELRRFYGNVEDYEINITGNTVQIFFQERGLRSPIPATRLSDGTLRYLCLLAVLCHPDPPPLVCVEEPELGLHPDV
ncbi:MAG: AAA family ATPase, partial [Acidaminococcales bacterium]|nr:AAA family ATPase [Acidaminococcales bacterium]